MFARYAICHMADGYPGGESRILRMKCERRGQAGCGPGAAAGELHHLQALPPPPPPSPRISVPSESSRTPRLARKNARPTRSRPRHAPRCLLPDLGPSLPGPQCGPRALPVPSRAGQPVLPRAPLSPALASPGGAGLPLRAPAHRRPVGPDPVVLRVAEPGNSSGHGQGWRPRAQLASVRPSTQSRPARQIPAVRDAFQCRAVDRTGIVPGGPARAARAQPSVAQATGAPGMGSAGPMPWEFVGRSRASRAGRPARRAARRLLAAREPPPASLRGRASIVPTKARRHRPRRFHPPSSISGDNNGASIPPVCLKRKGREMKVGER